MGEEARATGKPVKARVVGINHVALEVDDIDAALEFYGRIFEFSLRGRSADAAFIDMGDQFIALSKTHTQAPDKERHFGLVVDNREGLRSALEEANVEFLPGGGLDFLDPWGNRIQVVEYEDIQFTKAAHVLQGMGLGELGKSEQAMKELAKKGLAPK